MAKRKNANNGSVRKVPTLEEFREMRRMFNGDDSPGYYGTLNHFGINENSEFAKWWNMCFDDDEEEAFMLKYSKLGKLLRGQEDV